MEVAGPFACFTRPELKAERVSYPVMTPSAAKGLLESIYWKPEFDYLITRIEVLRPIAWFSIRRNEASSMLSHHWVARARRDPTLRYDIERDRDQRNTVCLRDVAYRISAQIRPRPHADGPEARWRDQFRRRVDRGACFSQPFLGTREFACDFGKAGDQPPIDHSADLGLMLHSIDYQPGGGENYRWFRARLQRGVLTVPEQGLLADPEIIAMGAP
ncbi:type I-C CRISPR-associated protein Cas5 [Marinitenerispora sediminis]|uniref:pre-crRNA processing endonuclease n=1 Tax=Marinitenerispora sediminis TaxID=1931232 RepID=A0A368SZZ0_9ACTN|nr:type I-C CRISPR-associated protein Cas5 [Marinitenerispora sediminis]RCV55779.1 type I-C CRISPR-associated protein Cas5 [Marinitenerispora sediminis]RCV57133.1 type I-C CRISPR-associated protein Cas5 [Marinitenerispora sediminis]